MVAHRAAQRESRGGVRAFYTQLAEACYSEAERIWRCCIFASLAERCDLHILVFYYGTSCFCSKTTTRFVWAKGLGEDGCMDEAMVRPSTRLRLHSRPVAAGAVFSTA